MPAALAGLVFAAQEELAELRDPRELNLFTVPERLASGGDAWAVGTSAGDGGPGHALALHCC